MIFKRVLHMTLYFVIAFAITLTGTYLTSLLVTMMTPNEKALENTVSVSIVFWTVIWAAHFLTCIGEDKHPLNDLLYFFKSLSVDKNS